MGADVYILTSSLLPLYKTRIGLAAKLQATHKKNVLVAPHSVEKWVL